jgi:hypothetical protein
VKGLEGSGCLSALGDGFKLLYIVEEDTDQYVLEPEIHPIVSIRSHPEFATIG